MNARTLFRRIPRLILIATLLTEPAAQAAQTVEGRLLERGTRTPLAGANVFVLPHQLKATTDAEGRFRFESVPDGDFTFVVNQAGYTRLEEPVRALGAKTSEEGFTLYLEKSRYTVYETTVVGQARQKDDSSRSLKAAEILQTPGSGNDPLKAVQNLPGINRPAAFSAQVIIQGSSLQDTRYLLDGHEVPIIFHFGGLTSVVPPESLDRVEYLAAGYGPTYSRAIGGLIGAWTRSPRTDRLHGLAYVDTFNAGLVLEGPIGKKSSFLIGARQSYIGAVLKAVASDDEGFALQSAPTFSDLTAIYETELGAKDRFRVLGVGSIDRLEFLFTEPNESDPGLRGDFFNRTAFFRLIPQWTHEHSKNTTTRLSLGFGRDQIEVDAGENFFDLDVWQLTARGEVDSRVSETWTTQVGFDNRYSWSEANLLLPVFNPEGGVSNPFSTGTLQSAELEQKFSNIGLFWRNEIQLAPGSAWTLLPGLRVDYFNSTGEILPAPRLGARYRLSDSTTLRAAGGLYVQPPQEQEVNTATGNPNLDAPRAWHLALGVDRDFRGGSDQGWTVSTGLFYRYFFEQVTPSTALVTRNGEQVPEYFANDERGRALGWETLARWNAQAWSGSLAYTLSQSKRWGEDVGTYPSPYDQTHLLTAIVARELPKNWRIGARLRYVTGNPITPVEGGTFDADNDVYFPVRGPFYSSRLAPFAQLDLRVDKRWIYDRWILSLYLDIQNATNRMNVEQIEYAYDYSTQEEVTGLPFFPIFGLRAEF